MSLFIASVFLIYGGINLYVFLKARTVLALGIVSSMPLIIFLLIMMLSPFIVRISERQGLEIFARYMAYTGFVWMGFVFLFFTSLLLIDLYRFLLYTGGFFLKNNFSYLKPSAVFSFYTALAISVVVLIYGFFEANNIKTEKITIKSSKIPEHIGKLKIVQISDVHLGLIVREARLRKILNEVKKADPDMLISTGDLVDGQINSMTGLARPFKEISPRYGKFAVTGNHEFYAGLAQAIKFTEKAGFTVLRGKGLTVGGIINIAGVDDKTGRQYGLFKDVPEKDLLSELPKDKFTLLLKHRPKIDKSSIGLFDIQISGHTHKGQIFPFSLITKFYFTLDNGKLELSENSFLYISRGSGTWGPPVRILSPPEVTVFEIVHEKAS